MLICACALEKQVIKSYTIRTWSCTNYESKSRGAEDDEKKVRRFQSEIEFMRSRWIGLLKAGDPCYNPNLTLASWNYGLRADGRGVKPWIK